jgi:hypothetical protein
MRGPDRHPRRVRRERRIATVERAVERLDVAAVKGTRQPGCDFVMVAFQGRPQRVDLAASRRLLGHRPITWQLYFKCPGCRRRCLTLFPDLGRWLCRKCCGLTYECRRLHNPARWRRRPLKMQAELGHRSDVLVERLVRPKRMRRDKFSLREARWWRVWAKAKTGLTPGQVLRNAISGRGRSH